MRNPPSRWGREGTWLFGLRSRTRRRSMCTCCELWGRRLWGHSLLIRPKRWLRLRALRALCRTCSRLPRSLPGLLLWKFRLANAQFFPIQCCRDWVFFWQNPRLVPWGLRSPSRGWDLRTCKYHHKYGTSHGQIQTWWDWWDVMRWDWLQFWSLCLFINFR